MNIELSKFKPLLKKLSCVKAETIVLDAENGVLAAKDGNLSVYLKNDILKDKEGDVYFFPSKKFMPSVNRMSGILTVRKTDNHYSLVSNKTRIELEKYDHPWKYDIELQNNAAIKTSALQNILQFVQIAADAKQDAMTFAGLISLKGHEDFLEGSRIEATATDGKRIAVMDEEATSSDLDVLLPASLVAVVGQFDGDLTYVQDCANFVLLHSNDLIAIANKFNGNFPNASALFPDTYDFNISVNPTEFFDALGRIQPMVNEETNSMGIEYKNGSIVLSTSGSGGSGKDEVAYEGPDKDYRAMYDHKFLTDFFSSVKDSSEKVIFKHKNNERFLVLEHGNKRYLMAQRTPGGK